MHWYGIFWPTATQITNSQTNTQALQLAFFLNHIMEPNYNYTWPGLPFLCVYDIISPGCYCFPTILSDRLWVSSILLPIPTGMQFSPIYPIPKNNNNNTTDITISSAACIYRACLSHYINSIHPSIRRSACLLGLSTVLLLLLLIQSHRPQRGASSLLVVLLLCEPHSKEEYRRHDDDWRMSRRQC